MKGLKVLVVDDMRSIGQVIAGVVEDLFPGCEVILATTPHEAFRALEHPQEVVISDLDLKNPIYNGTDILAKARQLYGRVLTILVSGDFGDIDGGEHHYISFRFEKPLRDVGQLERVIRNFMRTNVAQ
jgi:CheY-like chemotaxis protein